MSDMGDDFREHREFIRWQKAARMEEILEILGRAEIPFATDNSPEHLILRRAGHILDFWPTTGKWFDRKTGTRGCRLENFLAYYFAL